MLKSDWFRTDKHYGFLERIFRI